LILVDQNNISVIDLTTDQSFAIVNICQNMISSEICRSNIFKRIFNCNEKL